MDFEIFLSNYCSDKVKARASILNKKKYLDIQFLNESPTHNIHIKYNKDNHSLSLLFKLSPAKITLKRASITTSPASHVSSIKIIDIITDIQKKYIEYVAYPPDIEIDGEFHINNQIWNATNGSKFFINNNLEIIC